MTRPLIAGICGGIGSGKSTVAAALGRLGAAVLDADGIAHAVLADPSIRAVLARRFGPSILDTDGRVDRARVADLVFGPTPAHRAARADLEAIVHPEIRRRLLESLAALEASTPPPPVIVVDAALLVEGPLRGLCDAIIFVDVPTAVRLARTAASRGWSTDVHRAREAAQAPIDRKRALATHVIRNDGPEDRLAEEARILFDLLARDPVRETAPRGRPAFRAR